MDYNKLEVSELKLELDAGLVPTRLGGAAMPRWSTNSTEDFDRVLLWAPAASMGNDGEAQTTLSHLNLPPRTEDLVGSIINGLDQLGEIGGCLPEAQWHRWISDNLNANGARITKALKVYSDLSPKTIETEGAKCLAKSGLMNRDVYVAARGAGDLKRNQACLMTHDVDGSIVCSCLRANPKQRRTTCSSSELGFHGTLTNKEQYARTCGHDPDKAGPPKGGGGNKATCLCGKGFDSALKRDVHVSTSGDNRTHGTMPFELAQVEAQW